MLKLPFGCLETVWGEASWMSRDWGACCLDVMGGIVPNRRVGSRDVSESWELGQQIEVGVGVVLRAE